MGDNGNRRTRDTENLDTQPLLSCATVFEYKDDEVIPKVQALNPDRQKELFYHMQYAIRLDNQDKYTPEQQRKITGAAITLSLGQELGDSYMKLIGQRDALREQAKNPNLNPAEKESLTEQANVLQSQWDVRLTSHKPFSTAFEAQQTAIGKNWQETLLKDKTFMPELRGLLNEFDRTDIQQRDKRKAILESIFAKTTAAAGIPAEKIYLDITNKPGKKVNSELSSTGAYTDRFDIIMPISLLDNQTVSAAHLMKLLWHESGHVLQNRYLEGNMPETANVLEGATIEESALNILRRGKQFYFVPASAGLLYDANPEERHSKLFEDLGEEFGATLENPSKGAKK